MDKRPRLLLILVMIASIAALGITYYRTIVRADFAITESEEEPEEPLEALPVSPDIEQP